MNQFALKRLSVPSILNFLRYSQFYFYMWSYVGTPAGDGLSFKKNEKPLAMYLSNLLYFLFTEKSLPVIVFSLLVFQGNVRLSNKLLRILSSFVNSIQLERS